MTECSFTARLSKCHFRYQKLEYLGHTMGQDYFGQMHPRWKKPHSKNNIKSFLGLAGYYRCFLPAFSTIAVSLIELMWKGQPSMVQWGNICEKAFKELKNRLATHPVLYLPDFQKEFILRLMPINIWKECSCSNMVTPCTFGICKSATASCWTKQFSVRKRMSCYPLGYLKFQAYIYGRKFTFQTISHLHTLPIHRKEMGSWHTSYSFYNNTDTLRR